MSFRSQHWTAARDFVEETSSLADLARLEVAEREGDDPRGSVTKAISEQAAKLVAAATEDEKLEALEIVDDIPDSIISAALEGDSQDDDGTGPGETREGGESPSVAGDIETPKQGPGPRKAPAAIPTPRRRIVGRLVRIRQEDGTVVAIGFADLVARGGG